MSGLNLSFKVAATLAANRIVYLNATANTVAYGLTVTNIPIGITTDTVLDTNQGIPVQVNGIADLYFNDSVASGALVGVNANGQGIPYVAVTAASYAVGVLIDAKVNTTGTVAKVLIHPVSTRLT